MVKSICDDAPWCIQIDDESREPESDCAYAKLVGNGYTGLSLGSGDGKVWRSW